MFAYCLNNPVLHNDPRGDLAIPFFLDAFLGDGAEKKYGEKSRLARSLKKSKAVLNEFDKNVKKFIRSILIILGIMLSLTLFVSKSTLSHGEPEYKTIFVSEGDTLWNIAKTNQVKAILHGGDFFHRAKISNETITSIMEMWNNALINIDIQDLTFKLQSGIIDEVEFTKQINQYRNDNCKNI